MGFEKFGKQGYVSQSKVAPILSYLYNGELSGTRCKDCGAEYFPPRADCPRCRSSRLDWFSMTPECKLVSHTEVHFAPPQFQKETPYLLGVAETMGGLRVFAPIGSTVDKAELKPGMNLVLRIVRGDRDSVFYQLEKP